MNFHISNIDTESIQSPEPWFHSPLLSPPQLSRARFTLSVNVDDLPPNLILPLLDASNDTRERRSLSYLKPRENREEYPLATNNNHKISTSPKDPTFVEDVTMKRYVSTNCAKSAWEPNWYFLLYHNKDLSPLELNDNMIPCNCVTIKNKITETIYVTSIFRL